MAEHTAGMRNEDSGVQVRLVGREEAAAAFQLVREYYETIGVQAREDETGFLEEYFGERRGFWLAQVNGELAGCLALRALPAPQGEKRAKSGCGEIKRMYLREKWRGRGIAQKLLEAAEQFARDARYEWLFLDTAPGMNAAARLYESNGYERCERYNDNRQATIFMKKRISVYDDAR
jgi:GNAT superfamily N-acetyltransferase